MHSSIMTGMSRHAAASAQPTAVSAQLMDAIRRVKPLIEQIIRDCHNDEGGNMQPAVDEIVSICLKADVAYKKIFWVDMQVSTQKTVDRLVSARSMHKT